MAKQNVSIVERHVEKAVVGLTGVILLGAVVMYGIMQPNTQQAGSETVSPATIDERVTEAAEKVKRAITTANPEPKEIESAVPRLEQYRDVLASGGLLGRLPGVVAWQPMVPDVGRIVPQEGEILLAQGVKPTKPAVFSGRSTLALYPAVDPGEDPGSSVSDEEKDGYRQPVGWTTIAATFDFNMQKLAMKRAGYGLGFETPYLVGLDVQRREQRFDGTWSDDDWISVQQTRVYRAPEPPVITLETQADGKKVATTASRDAAQRYWEEIIDPLNQVELMRPWFPEPLNGNGWKPPTFPGVDLTRIDNELMQTELEPAGKDAIRDYTVMDIEQKLKVIKPEEQIKEWKQQIAAAEKAKNWQKAKELAELLFNYPETKESDRKEAEKQIGEFAFEIEKLAISSGSGTRQGVSTTVETRIGTKRSDLQLVWAHDANISSLHGGHTYQYRVRAKLHNNYYGNPGYLKNPDDATKPYVLGEWSEPSDPITIPPNSMFFVARGDPQKNQVRVASYQWAHGVWVDSSFEVSPGEKVGGIAARPVPESDRPIAILFNSGATALDIDFDRLTLEERSAGKGDFEAKPAQTVALVYLDDQGNVHERLALLDKQSPEKKALDDVVFDEKAFAKLGQDQTQPKREDQPTTPTKGGKGGKGGRGGGGRRG